MVKKISQIRFVIFAAILIFLAYVTAISWNEVATYANFNVKDMFLICFLHITFLVLNAKRFHILLEIYSSDQIEFKQWFRIYVGGTLINRFLPQIGNIYKGIELKRLANICYSGYAGALLWLSWVDILLCLSLALTLVALGRSIAEDSGFLLILVAVFVAIGISPLLLKHCFRISSGAPVGKRVRLVLRFLEAAVNPGLVRHHLNRFVVVIGLGIFGIVLMAYRLSLGFQAFGVNLSLADLLVLFALYKLTTLVMVTPGNLGVQEISIATLSDSLGYDFSGGFLASLLLRMCGYLSFVMLWVISALSGRVRR